MPIRDRGHLRVQVSLSRLQRRCRTSMCRIWIGILERGMILCLIIRISTLRIYVGDFRCIRTKHNCELGFQHNIPFDPFSFRVLFLFSFSFCLCFHISICRSSLDNKLFYSFLNLELITKGILHTYRYIEFLVQQFGDATISSLLHSYNRTSIPYSNDSPPLSSFLLSPSIPLREPPPSLLSMSVSIHACIATADHNCTNKE